MNELEPMPQPYSSLPIKRRPLGVTILAILEVILGLVMLLGSLGSFILAAMWNNPFVQDAISNSTLPESISGDMVLFFAIAGFVTLAVAAISFILAYGFIQGKKWAWPLGIAVGVIFMAWSFISIFMTGFDVVEITSLVISVGIIGLIIYYLYRPEVKAWFVN